MRSFSLADTAHVKGNVEQLTLVGSGNLDGTGNGLNNVITGNGGKNTLKGAAGNDQLNGGAGIDTLIGGTGNDRLNGGTGNDKLNGRAGNDRMIGGGGNDSFIFIGGFGKDVITDFKAGAGAGDVISFAKSLFATFNAVKSHAALDGHNDVVITFNANNKLTLDNVHKLSDLHASDFSFF